MKSLHKSALSWIVAGGAVAALALTGIYLHLHSSGYTDVAHVEANIRDVARERKFDLEEARKAGHEDKDIAAYLAKRDIAAFDVSWRRALVAVGGIYLAYALAVAAIALFRDSRQRDVTTALRCTEHS